MSKKYSPNLYKSLDQDIRSQLRTQAVKLYKIESEVLQIWLLAMLHLTKAGKLRPHIHFHWVRRENQSEGFEYDLLLPRLPLFKALSAFSRHFARLEQQTLFEVALCRKYELNTTKKGKQKLSARVPNKPFPKVFIGYRIAHNQIDHHLATIFNHPVAYRYKLENGQAELPKYPTI